MGKADDMRKQREARMAQLEGTAAPADERGAASSDEEGKCAVCGKLRALQNGLVTSHQKGLGKFCPGSRKPPG